MSDRIRRKDLSRFALVWIVIIVSVLILWTVGIFVVRAMLKEYEAVQPIHAAEKVFETYFREETPDELLEYSNLRITPYETTGDAVGYFRSMIAGKEFTYKEVIASDPDEKMYAVSAGDVTFASFILTSGEQTTEMLGLHYPELKTIEVSLKPLCGAVIYAPLQAEVRVNGVLLDSSAIEGEPVILGEEPYFASGAIDQRTMVNYSVTGLYAEPTVTVKEAGEGGRELTLEKEESVFNAELSYRTLLAEDYNEKIRAEEARRAAEEEARRQEEARKEAERQRISDEIKAQYGEFVLNMAKQYNKFIYSPTRAAIQNETKVFFKPNTSVYKYVTLGASGGYYNWSDFRFKTMDFDEIELGEFVWLDEAHTKFKCHLKMTVKMYGQDIDTGEWRNDAELFDMIPYVEISNKTLVYDMPTAAADAAAQEAAEKEAAQ